VANRQSGAVLRQLRTLFNVGAIGESTDGQLLERFATGRGEAPELAFAALVERHGPLVLRICRAVLRDEHDAQDAFQATFLVLVRKARSLWVRDSLGPWLHEVAHRSARCTRADRDRRRLHERRAAELASAEVTAGGSPSDFGRVLHEEIQRLPDRYRSPVVLCDLEGCTHETAARHLGCPVGTVKSRLARGRERLRSRLVRRGLAPSAGLVGATLSAETARSAVPSALAEVTVQAARRSAMSGMVGAAPASVAVLTKITLKSMSSSHVVAIAPACLLVLVAAIGAGALARQQPKAREPGIEGRQFGGAGLVQRIPPEDASFRGQVSPPPAAPEPARSPWPTRRPWPARPAQKRASSLRPFSTLHEREGRVWTAAFSPDGKRLATGSGGPAGHPGALKLWDVATGRELAGLGESRSVRWVAFSPDGKTLATAEHDGTAKLRDASSGAVLRTLAGHGSDGLDTATFSPDGKILATSSWDKTVKLWDVATAREIKTLRGHADHVYHVAFSPDGRTIVSASRDRTARLWDVETGEVRSTLRGHAGVVHNAAFSPDGKTVATASWDRTVKLWDVSTGQELATLRGHTVQALAVAFAPDGRSLASVSGSWGDRDYGPGPGELKIWDAATHENLATVPAHADKTFSVAYSPDGRRLATASWDRTVKLWDVGRLLGREPD
jgi:RNA polymerase sigma factor (sigma-70 family)